MGSLPISSAIPFILNPLSYIFLGNTTSGGTKIRIVISYGMTISPGMTISHDMRISPGIMASSDATVFCGSIFFNTTIFVQGT